MTDPAFTLTLDPHACSSTLTPSLTPTLTPTLTPALTPSLVVAAACPKGHYRTGCGGWTWLWWIGFNLTTGSSDHWLQPGRDDAGSCAECAVGYYKDDTNTGPRGRSVKTTELAREGAHRRARGSRLQRQNPHVCACHTIGALRAALAVMASGARPAAGSTVTTATRCRHSHCYIEPPRSSPALCAERGLPPKMSCFRPRPVSLPGEGERGPMHGVRRGEVQGGGQY